MSQENAAVNAPQPISPRQRLQQLLAIPESRRTDVEWDEINELEIKLASSNRPEHQQQQQQGARRNAPNNSKHHRPGGGQQGKRPFKFGDKSRRSR